MKAKSFLDHQTIASQLDFQKKNQWDVDADVDFTVGIDMTKTFLPLDEDAIGFPGANAKQKLALSQLMGLIVNSTIAEMEWVANKVRDTAWRDILHSYPVNPEMMALGEQFFLEEAKHAELFARYNRKFCEVNGINHKDLQKILPSAYGAVFQKAVKANAKAGGHAFWWVVAVVEEVSLMMYQQIYRHRQEIDPLYFAVQKKHFEEEARHTNYAFLMLDLIKARNQSLKQKLHLKLDLIYSELFSTTWVISEIHKFYRVKDLADKHPFFETLASCLPLLKKMPKTELIRRFFVSAPYISFILNRKHHKLSLKSAKDHKAFAFMYPKPAPSTTHIANLDPTEKSALDSESFNDPWKIVS